MAEDKKPQPHEETREIPPIEDGAKAPKPARAEPTDVMLMTFGDDPQDKPKKDADGKPAEGYGAPEDVPAEAIDILLDAVKARRFTSALIEPLMALLAYFWAKLMTSGQPRYGARGTSYGGAEVVTHLEAIRDGNKEKEAIPPMVVIRFLMAIFRLIKK